MTEKRAMSPKGFLNKATKAKSAIGFIAAYRDYLVNGELAAITSPIVAKIDSKELLPTPGLTEITNAVFTHVMAAEVAKAEKSLEKANQPAATKAVVARILNSKGEIVTRINEDGKEVELKASFDMGQEADRWVDRRLFDCESDCYGEIVHCKINLTNGPMTTLVMREDAIARILRKPKQPFMHKRPQTTNRLSFGVKATNDRFYFSKG